MTDTVLVLNVNPRGIHFATRLHIVIAFVSSLIQVLKFNSLFKLNTLRVVLKIIKLTS